VYVVAAGQFVNVLGSGIVYPFATIHFHLFLGIPLGLVGLGLLANNVATAAGTLVGGYVADSRGRKPVMVAGMASSAVTLSAYAVVTDAPGFVAVAAAAGLTVGLYTPAAQAMVADLTPGEDRDRAFGLLKVANNVGFGSGFVLGGLLYGLARTSVFVADGLTSGVVAAVLLVALPRVREGGGAGTAVGGLAARARRGVARWGRAVTRRRVFALAVLNVGFAVMYAQMQATVPVLAAERFGLAESEIGLLYVLNPLTIVLLQLPVVDRVAGWRRTRGLVVSAALWAGSFVAIAASYRTGSLLGVGLVAAFLVLRTLGEILHSPLATALMSDLGTDAERGSQLSLLEVAKRLGFGIGPVIGGAFFDAGLDRLLWPTLIAGCLVLAVGLLALERRLAPAENASAAAD
jgi:MFS family permease